MVALDLSLRGSVADDCSRAIPAVLAAGTNP